MDAVMFSKKKKKNARGDNLEKVAQEPSGIV